MCKHISQNGHDMSVMPRCPRHGQSRRARAVWHNCLELVHVEITLRRSRGGHGVRDGRMRVGFRDQPLLCILRHKRRQAPDGNS